MKKTLCFVAAIAVSMMAMTGCQEPANELPAPSITLSAVETAETSFSFTVAVKNVTDAAYLCLGAQEAAPAVEHILSTGVRIDVSQSSVTVEAAGLTAGTAYRIYAAAANEDVLVDKAAELPFTTLSPVVLPSVELTAGEVTETSFSFTVAASNADNAAYICYEAGEEMPGVDRILSEGTVIDPASSEPVVIEGLISATDYVVAVAASNADGAMTAPATLEFSTVNDLMAKVESSATLAWYYGPVEGAESDLLFLSLCNAQLDELTAMPSGEGELLRLYMYIDRTDADNPVIAPGTYTLELDGDTGEPFTLSYGNSVFALSTDEGWMQIDYESGEVVVEYADGIYGITANMVINDGEGSKVRAEFEGELKISDLTDGYFHFDTDITQVMTGLSGGIYPSSDTRFDNYTMTFYNCELDEDGFIVGKGYLFNTELYFTADEEDYSGTYGPNPDWESGSYYNFSYITGDVMNYYGFYMPMGTYLSEYDDQGSLIRIGLVVDGDIEIARADGNVTMSAVLTTSKGHEITVSYDGPEGVTDMTSASASASMKIRPVKDPAAESGVTGWRAL